MYDFVVAVGDPPPLALEPDLLALFLLDLRRAGDDLHRLIREAMAA
jgi:hypothetical protein